ncbi:MAG: hypothetical protein ACOZAM_06980 [Pseudomonadota bacterium]
MSIQESGPDVAVVETTINTERSSVDWPAVMAGAVIAAAISFVLFTFGTAVGLSLTSPYPAEGVSAVTFSLVLGLWIVLVTVMSFMAGGYFTGLLMQRRAAGDHEAEMRDGMHGVLAWGFGVLLGAVITAFTIAGPAKSGTDAAANMANAALSGADRTPVAYYADLLLRSDRPDSVAPAETEARRGEVTRLLARYPSGEVEAKDRTYLNQIVMRQTGLAEADATARVDTALADLRAAVAQARDAAEKARKFALFLGFAVAGALAVAAAAAWWAAVQGGEHRDQNVDLRPYIGWRREARLR